MSEELRTKCPQLRLQSHCGGGSFKSQLKKADRSGADIALIVGEDEASAGTLSIKYLRQSKEQVTVSLDEAVMLLSKS